MSLDLLTELLKDLGDAIKLPGLKPDEDGYCCLSFDDKITDPVIVPAVILFICGTLAS